MKKAIITIATIILTATAILFPKATKANTTEHRIYAKTAVVIELDRENDIVTVVDGAENFWEFYGVEDWETGDFASMLMDDNGTPENIFDDIIIEVTYAGTFNF